MKNLHEGAGRLFAGRLFTGLAATFVAAACAGETSSNSSSSASAESPEETVSASLAIGQLAVELLPGGRALVQWETELPSLGEVHYGKGRAGGAVAVESGAPSTQHSVELVGLQPRTKYFVSVGSPDTYAQLSEGPTHSAVIYTPEDDPLALAATAGGVVWQPFELDFEGPLASETDSTPNPFLDYRLSVEFTGPSGQVYDVPGFFDGDGQGGGTGNSYKVRFTPDEEGFWNYEVGFVSGANIAVSEAAGAALPLDGQAGNFAVQPLDPAAEGFYRYGMLECTNKHYLKFRNGPFFLKGGTDSPENFLGYKGFDNTFDQSGGASTATMPDGVHKFEPHVGDWNPGDPYFVSEDTGWDSKGIIGALNYLSEQGVNSIYFLPMNMGGDGRETVPFINYGSSDYSKTHYDISKLSQWNQVFVHAQQKGLLLHFVLGETESGNENWLDNGNLGHQRRLFYREMIARFGHAPAIKWNISEESDFSTSEVLSFATYITETDPYHRPVAFHTHLLSGAGDYSPYDAVLGEELIGATSLQGQPHDAGQQVEQWRTASANAGHKWVVDFDEQGSASVGLTDSNAADLRKSMLWDVYLSGGQIEWYAGYHALPLGGDMRLENFRTREEMWGYTRIARSFVEQLPFSLMEPADHLVSGESGYYGGAEVFAWPGKLYAIYYPSGSQTGMLDLSGTSGWLNKRWFNPRTGNFLPGAERIQGGGPHQVGPPPVVSGAGPGGFQEQNGLVVAEIESVQTSSGWTEESHHSGFAGSSYYRWTGPNHFSNPGNGIIAYDINVTTPGDYRLAIHNRHNHSQPDQENDVWVRMDGGTWFKLFSNAGNSSVGVWNWHSEFDLDNDVNAHFELDSGTHRLEFSGRSYGFMMDRFHLYLPGVSNAHSLSQPESSYSEGSDSNEDWVLMIRRT